MGGAHIDVTTLKRNHYYFLKVKDLSCGLHGFVTVVACVGPLLFHDFQQNKVCLERDTCEKAGKKLCFRVGGAHINVTTLKQSNYFF